MNASRKTSTVPTVKPEDLSRLMVDGNRFTFWKRSELSPRRSRELSIYEMAIMPRMIDLLRSQGKLAEEHADEMTLEDIPVGLTLEENRQIWEMNEVAVYAFLKTWTLKKGGEPAPLPESIEEVQELPRKIYDALLAHVGKLMRVKQSDFSVDSVEDDDSPTKPFDE